jgi:hypothetical protein
MTLLRSILASLSEDDLRAGDALAARMAVSEAELRPIVRKLFREMLAGPGST